MNREQWLTDAVEELGKLFTDHGYDTPRAHVSVGFPSKGGTSTKKQVIGQCWSPSTSEDGVPHIYISPVLQDPVQVLTTLLHELVHAWDKNTHGHRGMFIEVAKDVGLVKPWTSTSAGEELALTLQDISDTLGEYPHSRLKPSSVERKVAKTYMVKVSCGDSGYVARTTQKWLDLYGPPVCPCCDTPMKGEDNGR